MLSLTENLRSKIKMAEFDYSRRCLQITRQNTASCETGYGRYFINVARTNPTDKGEMIDEICYTGHHKEEE
jgi:hypothetical protein